MKKIKIKKIDLFYWGCSMIPFLISAIFYPSLPEEMAIHWDMAGHPNGYASKVFACWGLPAILLATTVFVNVMMRLDPKKENIDRSKNMKWLGKWFIVIIAIFVQVMTVIQNHGQQIDISFWTMLLISVLFVAIGNYLPKCQFNYTVGIRTPWTLADEEIWCRTHRISGKIWIAGGILMLISAIFKFGWLMWIALIPMVVIPFIYSYLLFQKKKHMEQSK